MMKEKNCKIVGGSCSIFGFILFVASCVYLNYVVNLDCPQIVNGSTANFDNVNDDDDKYGSEYVRPKRDINQDHISGNSPCKISTLTFCAGFGLTISLIQIILSGLLCSARKLNTRLCSLIWCIGHGIICVALILIFAVDLSYDWKKNDAKEYDGMLVYTKTKEVVFLVITALDFILLLPFLICVTFFLMKKSDYQDYSSNDGEPIVYRQQ